MGVVLTMTDARMKVYFAFDGSGCLGPGINSMHLILMVRTLVEEYVCTIYLMYITRGYRLPHLFFKRL